MLGVDEQLAMSVVASQWPVGLPDDEDLMLPTSRYWRTLQALHGAGGGQLSQMLVTLSPADLDGLRYPHPEVLQILDSRPLVDEAAQLGASFGGGWLVDEIRAAGLHHGRAVWSGTERNVGRTLKAAADDPGMAVHIVS